MKASSFFMLLFLFVFYSAKSQINLQEGIVAAFPISGDANDESSNNNDCNLPVGVTLTEDRFGLQNSALLFDGNSYLECGSGNGLDNLSLPVSLSFWYFIEQENIGEFLPIFFTDDNNGNTGNYYGFFSFIQNRKFWFGYGDGSGPNINDRRGVFSDSLVISGKWANIIGTIDINKNIKIYINGVDAKGTRNGDSGLSAVHNPNYPIRIGLRSRYGPTYFKGKLDEIYLWNRVLTSDEIQTIVNNGLSTEVDDLINSKVKIYPNPSKTQVFIEGLEKITQNKMNFQIFDIYGRSIMSSEIVPAIRNNINISSISSGKYIIRFLNNDAFVSKVILIY